jgi:hypothetical protein
MKMYLPRQEQITNTSTREIETRRWATALDDFKRNDIEYRSDKLFLCCRDVCPQRMLCFDNLEPFLPCGSTLFGKAVIEEGLDCGFLAAVVVGVIRDQTYETT